MSTTDPESRPDPTGPTESDEHPGEDSTAAPLTEDDYALGRTSDPDGASREEPAGEDYAGSGF